MLQTVSISILLSGIRVGIHLRPVREEENIPSNETYDPNSEILFAYYNYPSPPYIVLCEKGKNCENPLNSLLHTEHHCQILDTR